MATHTFATKSGSISLADLDAALLEAAKAIPYLPLSINTQTSTPYVLVLADAGFPGRIVRCTLGSAFQVTIPLDSTAAFPLGSRIQIDQWGAGQVTVVGTGGVTLRNPITAKTRAQYSRVFLQKIGTDEWLIHGDLAAS